MLGSYSMYVRCKRVIYELTVCSIPPEAILDLVVLCFLSFFLGGSVTPSSLVCGFFFLLSLHGMDSTYDHCESFV